MRQRLLPTADRIDESTTPTCSSCFEPRRRPLDHPIGYLVSIAAMITQMCVFGTGYAFSVFLNAMSADATLGHPSRAWVAAASGVNFGIGPFVGCLSGKLSDVFGPRRIVMFAAICHAAALILASYASTPLQLVFAYGPLMGCAFGCMVTPGSHATSSYFDKYRSAAMGVNYAGGGAGAALIPHVASLILAHYADADWRPALRWMSLLAIGCFVPALALTKRPHDEEEGDKGRLNHQGAAVNDDEPSPPAVSASPPAAVQLPNTAAVTGGPIVSIASLLLTRRFVSLFSVAVMFGYAFYSTVFFWVPFARAQGKAPYEARLTISLVGATAVTITFGAVQAVANILIGIAASHFNANIAYVASTMLFAAALFAWPWCSELWQLLIVASCAGCGAAGARTIFPALTAHHFPPSVVGTMMGFTFMGYGVGGLCGPPIT